MTQRLTGKVDKGWGFEIVWATTDNYAGKLLVFPRLGGKTSMVFHKEKTKSWFVNAGQFRLVYANTATATYMEKILNEGDTWECLPLVPHQLVALKPDSIIFEVSTPDSVEDNYRIIPGDTQIGHVEPTQAAADNSQ